VEQQRDQVGHVLQQLGPERYNNNYNIPYLSP